MRIVLLLITAVLLAGCGDSYSKPKPRTLSVDYQIDRKFSWNKETDQLSGTLLMKAEATGKGNFSFNAYGVTFELAPGERTTIIVKADTDGIYFNGEYPDLPVRLPQLLSGHTGSFSDLFDYDVRAICELELSQEPFNGSRILFISCFDVSTSWLFSTEFVIDPQNPPTDQAYCTLAEGRQTYKRVY